MVDVPLPPPESAFVEPDKSNSDIRERINLVRVTFAKVRALAQSENGGSNNGGSNKEPKSAQFDNFNQALPFQNFNEFHNFNDFSNFNNFTNFNDFSNS